LDGRLSRLTSQLQTQTPRIHWQISKIIAKTVKKRGVVLVPQAYLERDPDDVLKQTEEEGQAIGGNVKTKTRQRKTRRPEQDKAKPRE
jgi:hypothetical protein